MKHATQLLLAVTFCGALSAQPTITDQYIATLGDTVLLFEDTSNANLIDLGLAAGNQTWDFSFLVEHNPDGAVLEDPSSAPLSSNYPNADFVLNDLVDDSVHIFFDATDSTLDVIGFVEYDSNGQPALPEFAFGFKFLDYPANYGDSSFQETFAFVQSSAIGIDPDSNGPHPFIDSLRSTFYFRTHVAYDAWGTLTLPGGEFTALRQVSWSGGRGRAEWYGDNTWQPIGTSSFLTGIIDSVTIYEDAEREYRWWTDNAAPNFWLARLDVDSNGQVRDSISFYNGEPAPPIGISETSARLTVYPNPAHRVLTLHSSYEGVKVASLIDVQGRTVQRTSFTSNQVTMELEGVGAGF